MRKERGINECTCDGKIFVTSKSLEKYRKGKLTDSSLEK